MGGGNPASRTPDKKRLVFAKKWRDIAANGLLRVRGYLGLLIYSNSTTGIMKKKNKLVFGPLVMGLCALPTDPGLAAFDAFLKIDGIPGESSDVIHKHEIEIESWSYGMSQSAGGTNGGYIKVTKEIDKATPLLCFSSASGQSLNEVLLTLRYPGGTNQVEYMTFKLKDVLIERMQGGGGATDLAARPAEEVTFNFGTIEWTYQPVTAEGAPSGPPIVTGWTNSAVLPTGQ